MVTLFRPQDMVIPLLPKLLAKETTQTCGGPKSHSMIPNIQMKPKLIVKNTKPLLDNKCFSIFLCYCLSLLFYHPFPLNSRQPRHLGPIITHLQTSVNIVT